jgi:hypothetical protein
VSILRITLVIIAVAPSLAAAQTASWTPELSVSAGLGHVFRWEDRSFGDRANVGGGVAISRPSGWALEIAGDRTSGLEPPLAACGIANVTCVGVGHDGPRSIAVASLTVHYRFRARRVQPHVFGGLGMMWSRSVHSVTHVRGPIATISESESRDRGFGPDLGAGLRLAIGRRLSISSEVRWLDAPWRSRQNLAITRLQLRVTYAIRSSGKPPLPLRQQP